MAVGFDAEETGLPVVGTLRFHNASGMVSWQPPDVEQPGSIHFSKREIVAIARAVLGHEGYVIHKPLPFPSADAESLCRTGGR